MNLGEKIFGRTKTHMFQKLKPYDKVKKLKFPCYISQKMDGVFCAAVEHEGNIEIMSRTGEVYKSLEHIKPYLKSFLKVSKSCHTVLFEAVIPNEDQSVVSGACRDTKSQHPEVKAFIYGVVGKNEGKDMIRFTTGDGNRFIHPTIPYITLVHREVNSEEEIMEIYDQVRAAGGEGVVLNQKMIQEYQPGKRNATLIKLKGNLSFDLEVVGTSEGKIGTKYEGTLGSLAVRFKDDTIINVSGMTDEQRNAWWECPEDIVGKIVQVDAMTYSSNGSLREPRFKGIRYDKTEADY